MSFDISNYAQTTGNFLNAKEVKATWQEMNQSGMMRNAKIMSVIPSQEVIGGNPRLKVSQYKSGKKAGQYYIRWRFEVAEPQKNRWCAFSVFIDCINQGGEIDRNSIGWHILRNDFGILANIDINNSADLREEIIPTQNGGFIKYAGLENLTLDFMIEIVGIYNGHANANLVQIFAREKSSREVYAERQGNPLAQSVSDAVMAWARVKCKDAFDLNGGLPAAPSIAPMPAAPSQMPRMPANPYVAPQVAPQARPQPQNAPVSEEDIPF